ncbi:MAG: DUF4087 domain-containing protein [Sphingomonadales bacterium]|nr:MAG: DUF4087 domain-containing protein [Sphingomonadales bacterium]
MRRVSMILAAISATIAPGALADTAPPAQRVMLCGWVQNPTPANWWLTDSIGDWTMGTQGGEQAQGMDLIPDLTGKQWVRTNGYYGYGCGCVSATVDRKNTRILRIHSFKQKPLATCRSDRKLPKPG